MSRSQKQFGCRACGEFKSDTQKTHSIFKKIVPAKAQPAYFKGLSCFKITEPWLNQHTHSIPGYGNYMQNVRKISELIWTGQCYSVSFLFKGEGFVFVFFVIFLSLSGTEPTCIMSVDTVVQKFGQEIVEIVSLYSIVSRTSDRGL